MFLKNFLKVLTPTSAGRTFGSGYFCHFASVLELRHIRTRRKRLVFLPRVSTEVEARYSTSVLLRTEAICTSPPYSPPETLGNHHGSTTAPSTTATFKTQNKRSAVTTIFSFIVRAICESCHHHGTSMFSIHKNVNITLA